MANLRDTVAVVGVGGCGTNIAFQFEKLGYNTLHINSSTQDENAISSAKKVMHLKGYDGCAGDRTKAIDAIRDNENLIDCIAEMEEEVIFVCFGAGGGTGSGIGPALASIVADETNKTVCCIVALPAFSEDMGSLMNAYNCAKELSEIDNIGCTIFVDNNKNDKKLELNRDVANLINSFVSNDSSSILGNVDSGEKKLVLSQPGYLVMTVGHNTIESIIETINTANIFAPLQDNNYCENIAIINQNNNEIDRSRLVSVFGEPVHTFTGYGAKETIVVASGLPYPFDHILAIREAAKTKNDNRQNRRAYKLSDIDFGVGVRREEKENIQSVNRRDLIFRRK